MMNMEIEPPLLVSYFNLMKDGESEKTLKEVDERSETSVDEDGEERETELPVIDLGLMKLGNLERERCKSQIVEAAKSWGFFQVVNHGILEGLLKEMMFEQKKVFYEPFAKKSLRNFLNLTGGSYRWGNPMAISPNQISWSEALHIAAFEVPKLDDDDDDDDDDHMISLTLRSTVEAVLKNFGSLAESIAEILGQSLGMKSGYFKENCLRGRSSFRLNRYPPCPFPSRVYGLIPHTDSDYLTIVYQAQVKGLQIFKDGKWFHVNPNPKALLVNIGDLLQVVSNGLFKSLKHRVRASEEGVERFSFAYFYCPSDDVIIESYSKPTIYRHFSYKQYRQQIEKDVEKTGNKVGISRFLL